MEAPVKLDKDFGAWEKHTKGVGLKLLQKFGFKGRLGANETGITTAIESTVRPAGAGLGFGNKEKGGEGGSLGSNKKRAAPVSDTEKIASLNSWKKKEKKEKQAVLEKTISELLSARDANAAGDGKSRDANMTIIDMRSEVVRNITADEIGGSEDGSGVKFGEELLYNLDKMNREIALDISIKRNQLQHEHSARTRSCENSVAEITQLMELDSARVDALDSVLVCLGRVSQLEQELLAEERTHPQEEMELEYGSATTSSSQLAASQVEAVGNIVREVVGVLVAYPQTCMAQDIPGAYARLFGRFLARRVRVGWTQPLRRPGFLAALARPWFRAVDAVLADDGSSASPADVGGYGFDYLVNRVAGALEGGLQTALEVACGGSIRRALMSDWDLVRDSVVVGEAPAIQLVSDLGTLISPAANIDLCLTVVLPKLANAVSALGEYDPGRGMGGGSVSQQLEAVAGWVQPWVRIFDRPVLREADVPGVTAFTYGQSGSGSKLSSGSGSAGSNKVVELYPDIRRKLRQFLTKKSVVSDATLIQSLLLPWCHPDPSATLTNFELNSYVGLVNNALVPKLVDLIRNDLIINPAGQNLGPLQCLLGYWAPDAASGSSAGVLPTVTLVHILEGELFPRWLHTLCQWATQVVEDEASGISSDSNAGGGGSAALREVAQWYMGWRALLPETLLDRCPGLLRYFSVALAVIGAAADALNRTENVLVLPRVVAEMSKYRSQSHGRVAREDVAGGGGCCWTGADRFTAAVIAAASSKTAASALPRGSGTGGGVHMSFKDTLEMLAQRRGMDFLPRVPHRFHESGKQLYVLGAAGTGTTSGGVSGITCFIDNDVLFTAAAGAGAGATVWNPVSLDEAVALAADAVK